MGRDYETPEDYAGSDHEAWDQEDDHTSRIAEADREEAAVRRWEARREMPHDDEPEPDDTVYEYAAWLRREEYGDQDAPDIGEAA
jgi:hypothetical protein